jgi:tetratricopeptide (TPR) repeat protein
MDWREAAESFPLLEAKDLSRLNLSKEEQEYVLVLFNRAVLNARSDGSDIALIALKKLLTEYPAWGEAALLFGICLAIDGKYKRAGASFEHALSAGLISEQLTYLAQVGSREAAGDYAKNKRRTAELEDGKKSLLSTILPPKNKRSIFKEIDTEERGHVQAPILTRAPRSPGKARLASDKERRDILMQANAGGDVNDDEIDVTIPKTPAEKMRITAIVFGTIAGALALGFLVWFFVIPGIYTINENQQSADKLKYLVGALEANETDPEVAKILSEYKAAYEPQVSGAQTTPAASSAETSAALTPTQTPTAAETAAAQGVSITPTGAPTQAAGTDSTDTTAATESTSPAP